MHSSKDLLYSSFPLITRPEHIITAWEIEKPEGSLAPHFITFLKQTANKITLDPVFGPIDRNLKNLCQYFSGISSDQLRFTPSFSIKSVVTLQFEERFGCTSLITETCVLCPMSKDQAECLDHLNERWSFLVDVRPRQKSAPAPKTQNDVIVSLFFEMLRVYAHPFLGGCTEQLLLEQHVGQSWQTVFRTSSSKIMVCDLLLKALAMNVHELAEQERTSNVFQEMWSEGAGLKAPQASTSSSSDQSDSRNDVSNKHTDWELASSSNEKDGHDMNSNRHVGVCLGVYAKSLRFCQFLHRYYQAMGYPVIPYVHWTKEIDCDSLLDHIIYSMNE